MKYLKIYESFRKESIMNDMMDISLDIQDEGFTVRLKRHRDESSFVFLIEKRYGHNIAQYFDIKVIKDFLIRVIEYGNTSPCDISVHVPQRNHSDQTNTLHIRTLKSERILDYRISYVEILVRVYS